MAAADDQPRTGVSRRDALRLLAASTTTVAAGSMIISQPAHADSGSTPCRYDFSPSPTVTVRMINQSGNRRDCPLDHRRRRRQCPSVHAVPGRPTGPSTPTTSRIPNTGTGGIGWITSSSVSVSSPAVLWPNDGGTRHDLGRCPGHVPGRGRHRGAMPVRHRHVHRRTEPDSTRFTFTLGSNNGDSAPLRAALL